MVREIAAQLLIELHLHFSDENFSGVLHHAQRLLTMREIWSQNLSPQKLRVDLGRALICASQRPIVGFELIE